MTHALLQLEAAAVNLVAGKKPADVYSEIARRYTIFFSFIDFIFFPYVNEVFGHMYAYL